MPIVRVSFIAGHLGEWKIERIVPVRGDPLPAALRLRRLEAATFDSPADASWVLHGVRSHDRYLKRAEADRLTEVQPCLGRPGSTLAALIPVKKSEIWWDLPQKERREIFEERSHHIVVGLEYLPAISRQLYHCHDLGATFDFLTWFEFAEADRNRFEELVSRLHETEEWRYVVREVDIRLSLSS